MRKKSSAYQRLCALYGRVLSKMRQLNSSLWRFFQAKREAAMAQVESLEPRLLLAAGMTGQYFPTTDLSGPAAVTRIDNAVDFNWQGVAPASGVTGGAFSAQWTGKLTAEQSESYTFYTETDGGVKLSVNGQQIINDWADHALTEDTGTIDLVAGQQYDIQLAYYNDGGAAQASLQWSSPSTTKAVIPTCDLTALAAPSSLSAVPYSSSQMNLAWTDNSNNETSFTIDRATDPDFAQNLTSTAVAANTTSYSDMTIEPEILYYYRVRATNDAGDSDESNVVSADPSNVALGKAASASSSYSSSTTPNYAVDGSTSTAWHSVYPGAQGWNNGQQWLYVDLGQECQNIEVKLDWNSAYAKTYQVQVSDDPNYSASSWATVAGETNNTAAGWKDYTGLNATGRYVRVNMTQPGTSSGYSLIEMQVYGTVIGQQPTIPTAPTNLAAAPYASTAATLTWTNPGGATYFRIDRATDANFQTNLTSTLVEGTTSSYLDATQSAATTYYYRMIAGNGGGDSAESATLSYTSLGNVALNKPAVASSTYQTYVAGNAVDNSTSTYWRSVYPGATGWNAGQQTFYVDLGQDYNLDEVKLDWTAAYGAAYQVQVAENANGPWTNVPGAAETSNTASGWKDYAGLNVTGRYVQVSITTPGTSSGYGLYEVQVFGVVPPPPPIPAAPSGLTVAGISSSQVNLSWIDNSTNETGFKIDRATDPGFATNLTTSTVAANTTSYSDTSVVAGTTYYYRVRSTNTAGDSANTNVVSIEPLATASGLTVAGVSSSAVNLLWTDNSDNETSFQIDRATNPGFTAGLTTFMAAANATGYNDTTVVAGTTYYYRVRAANASGNSDNSAAVTASPLFAPSNLAATGVSSIAVALSWTDNSSNETGFVIDRATGAGFASNMTTVTVAPNATSYLDTTVAAGTTYYYRVRAVNATGNSDNSTAATIEPLAAPSPLMVLAASVAGVSLVWTDNSDNETGFTIDRAANASFTSGLTTFTAAAGSTSYSDTSVSANTTYFYRVRAINAVGNSTNSNVVTVGPPVAPSGLAAAFAGGEANLSWADNSENETGFQIDRSTLADFSRDLVTLTADANAASYADSAVAAGTHYYYRVRAVNAMGTLGNSIAADVTTPAVTADAATFVGASGLPLTLQAGQSYAVNVVMRNTGSATWLSAGDYRLGSQSPQDNANWGLARVQMPANVATGQEVTFQFTITAPADAGTYGFQWRMVHEYVQWFGDCTPAQSVTVLDATQVPTAAPSNLAAATSNGAVNLSWQDNSTNEADFQIDRATNSAFTQGLTTLTARANTSSYTDSAVAAGTHYYYRIRAVNAAGQSDNSAAADVITPAVTADSAASVSITSLPVTMTAGASYDVTVVMRNTGSATWTAGNVYRLGSQDPQDNSNWGIGRAYLSSDVATGQEATFQFTVTAPADPGSYGFQWRMVHDGVAWFGSLTPDQTITIVGATEPPTAAPSSLTAAVSNGAVNLTWADNSTNEALFHIDRATDASFTQNLTTQTARANTTSYTDTTVAAGTHYFYRIRAVNAAGQSDNSLAADLTTPAVTADSAALVSITGLPTTMVAGASYDVTVVMMNTGTATWTAGGVWHLGSQDPQDNSNWGSGRVPLTSDVATGQEATFQFTVMAPGDVGIYGFQWRMVHEFVAWFGDYTPAEQVTVVDATEPPTAAPSGLVATLAAGAVSLSWSDNSDNEANFQIDRATNAAFTAGLTTFTLHANTTSYTDTAVAVGTHYFYRVRAVNAVGQSDNSAAADVTTPAVTADSALVVSVTGLPATMTAGASYAVAVVMRNTGLATWAAGGDYRLGAQNPSDNANWGFGRVQMPTDVATGQEATFQFTVTAPGDVGTYGFQWRMVHDGVAWFGGLTPDQQIMIVGATQAPTAAPSGLAATAANGAVSLTWTDNSTDEAHFRIQRATSSDFSQDLITLTTRPNATSCTDGTVAAGTHYYYRIQAVNAAGQSAYSQAADLTTAAVAADAATLVSVTGLPTTVYVGSAYIVTVVMRNTGSATWAAGGDYRLGAQDPSDNTNWGLGRVQMQADVATGQEATFQFTVTVPGGLGTYGFQWRMVHDGMQWFGDCTPAQTVTVLQPIPAAPSNLTIRPYCGIASQFDLTWTDNSNNETSFQLQRATNAQFTANLVTTTLPANTTSFTDPNVSPGTNYYYRVCAVNATGPSTYSDVVSDDPGNVAFGDPVASSTYLDYGPGKVNDGNLQVQWHSVYPGTPQWNQTQWVYVDLGQDYNVSDVKLYWGSAYARAYQIQISDDPNANANWTNLPGAGESNNSTYWQWQDYQVGGTGRFVRVLMTTPQFTAPMAGGYSLIEMQVTGQPLDPQPTAAPTTPTFQSVAPYSSTAATLNWTNPEGATYFEIDRSTDPIFPASSTIPASVEGNTSSYFDAAQLPGTTYYYRIKAGNGGGDSPWVGVDYTSPDNVASTSINSSASATASSSYTGNPPNSYAADNAIDGSTATYWHSSYPGTQDWDNGQQWLNVDLGAVYDISQVKLKWNGAYAKTYGVQVMSPDGTWNSVAGEANCTPDNGDPYPSHPTKDYSGLTATGEYVRISMTTPEFDSPAAGGYGLTELEVYGLLTGQCSVPFQQPPSIPAAPSNLLVTGGVSSHLAYLTWTNNANCATSLKIDRATDANFTTNLTTFTVAANIDYYSDLTVTGGTTYFYRIRSSNVTGDSTNSNVASIEPLAAPSELSATALSPADIGLNWVNNSDNATRLLIVRATNAGFTADLMTFTVAADATTYYDAMLVDNTTYFYYVQAANAAGYSSISNVISVSVA